MKRNNRKDTLHFIKPSGPHVVAIFLLFCSPIPTFAQTVQTPKSQAENISPVDELAQELADEYADILEKIHDMIGDYTDYLSEIGDKNLTIELSFERFNTAFKSSNYSDDPDQLETDIDTYTSNLDRLDRECSQGSSARGAKGCRVVRSLKRELNLIAEQLASHQEHLEESSYSHDQVGKAMKDAFAPNRELTKQSLKIARKAVEQAAKELERIDMTVVPRAPQGTSAPTPPSTRSYTKTKKGTISGRSGEAGTQRSATGTLTVGSTSIPVIVSNPNGSVEITGTSGKTIEVSLDFEIVSSSRTREKELAEAMGLELSSERNGYHVEVTVPKLSDPHTKILNNTLVISVPSELRVISKSAYGNVSITGINGFVDATSSYSAMDISDCGGGVTAANSMASISLTDCIGKLQIQNSYGGVEISECSGNSTISNAYAPVSLSDSRGQVTIHNSGEVSVTQHNGQVSINNQYGAVLVSDVKGNVYIQNAYQSIEAEHIDGQVRIENNYSPISISGVTGRSILINRFAEIRGENIVGPFDITNQNGAVELSLGRTFSGPCTINASYGSVQLDIPKSLNLVIAAKTSNGEIRSSSYPIELSKTGMNKSGIIRVGTGRDSISIIGSNTAIDISESR